MSVEQSNIIDAIGIEQHSDSVILTISDHLSWEDAEEHLLILQEKINTYISFYESGEIYESYPKAKNRDIVIKIIGNHPLPDAGQRFISNARIVLEEIGLQLQFSQLV